MTKQAKPSEERVLIDHKKLRYVRMIDPHLARREDFEWVTEAESTKFPDSGTAFDAWNALKKLKIPNLRVAPAGWKH